MYLSLYVSLFLSRRDTSILPLKLLLGFCLNEVKFDLSFVELNRSLEHVQRKYY